MFLKTRWTAAIALVAVLVLPMSGQAQAQIRSNQLQGYRLPTGQYVWPPPTRIYWLNGMTVYQLQNRSTWGYWPYGYGPYYSWPYSNSHYGRWSNRRLPR